jgi:putative ABC transport system permease protein
LNVLQQIFEITLLNLRNIRARRGASSVIVVGIAGVVAVLIGLLSMSAGFAAALKDSSQPNRAIVLRTGSTDEMGSWLGNDEVNVITQLPSILHASGELYVALDIPKRTTHKMATVVGRGVQAAAFAVRPELHIVEGRTFTPGRSEMLVGISAAREYVGLKIGDRVDLRDQAWTVVGQFETGGTATESEVWLDLATAQSVFRRGGAVSSLRVQLEDPAQAAQVSTQIQNDPRLRAALISESDFYAGQTKAQTALIETFAYFIAGIMAVGAVIAALNSMYAAVSARTVEIATLRALGFGNVPVVASVMIEAIALALFGGLLGGALVYVMFDGYGASTLNNASHAQLAFAFVVTPNLLQLGIAWALALGFIGGLLPALRAARLPITTALRGE